MQKIAVLSVALSVCASVAAQAGQLGSPVDLQFIAGYDGTVQRYVQMLPAGFDPTESHDVLIALHGHGSDRWQYATNTRDECRGARDVAGSRNMIFISPDYRASTSWIGPAAEADVVQLIGLLKSQHNVRNVILCGASMGGASSLIFTALHPDLVDGVCSSNGTANMMEYNNPSFTSAIAASYGGTKAQVPEQYTMRSPELFPGQFTMPVAFTVGGNDTVVPPDSVRRLAAELQTLGLSDVLMIDRPTGGHSTSYADTVAGLEFVMNAVPEPATMGLLGVGLAALIARKRRSR